MYDFRTLSPIDFELLVRDLLQADLGITMESFGPGKDGGIDFRFALADQDVVVQAKHHVEGGPRSLLRAARKEDSKVLKLAPSRYILVTSLSLTPELKRRIIQEMPSTPVSAGDVIGREDLNNFLGLHPHVLRQHFKLWLTSTEVLERILHSAVYNRTDAELARIKQLVPKFVHNASVAEAEAILEDRGALIIAGEGLETSFATNILSHYLFTREMLSRGLLRDDATVIEVSSGGMYNHMLVVNELNITGDGYLGVRAYGLSKRAQVVMTQHWRQKFADSKLRFYAMHPGWVDTAAVGRSMPRFRAILKSVLRRDEQGADTIVWLAETRPTQKSDESIWFDRRERPAHIFAHTPKAVDTPESLIRSLESYCIRPLERAAA